MEEDGSNQCRAWVYLNIEVPVTREELVIERTPASGQTATGKIGKDQGIRVPLSEEPVRTEKQAVVNEEVRVGKRAAQRTENVSDDVRHEELKVDKADDVDITRLRQEKEARSVENLPARRRFRSEARAAEEAVTKLGRPSGTCPLLPTFPALTRWAKFGRPFGLGFYFCDPTVPSIEEVA